MALEYFEPAITNSEEDPEWLEDWTEFVRTLCTQFGPIDPTGDAESGLDHLKMCYAFPLRRSYYLIILFFISIT